MSFSARLFHRRRPFDRPKRAPPRASLHSEDAQPNEVICRKRDGAPPAVKASMPSLPDVKRGRAAATVPASGVRSVNHTPPIPAHNPVFSPAPPVDSASWDMGRPPSWTNPQNSQPHPAPSRQTTSLDVHAPPSSSSSSQKRPRKRRKSSSNAAAHARPPTRLGGSQGPVKPIQSMADATRLRSSIDPLGVQVVDTDAIFAPAPNTSHTNASASDLLLNDLGVGMPPTTRGPPPAKRRKGATSIDVSSASGATGSTQNVPISPVKRERSPSPAMPASPPLITQGCVRVAPLPINCRKTHPGYQAARQQVAKVEMDKLRRLGLQPLRVFTREDGMVIDWRSDVPVSSDTLRPPSPEQQPIAEREPTHLDEHRNSSVRPTGAVVRGDHPGADGHEEAMVQAHLFPIRSPVRQDTGPTALPAIAEGSHLNDQDDRRTPELALRASASGKKRGSEHLAGHSSMLVNVVDLTKEDDRTPHVPELSSETGSHPVLLPKTQTSTAHSDTGPSNALSLSQPPLGTSIGSYASPEPNKRASLPRTVSISSDNSDLDETVAAALDFLKKYMVAFSEDRAVLARAYSRMATLSIIAPTGPADTVARGAPCQGRASIVSALLALPNEQLLYDEVGEGMAEVDWDLVCVEDTGDVLLIYYATHDRAASPGPDGKGASGKGKGKGRADRWVYEQRFLLRRKDWDSEDRNTPGLWPLVAVLHQMTIKPLLDL